MTTQPLREKLDALALKRDNKTFGQLVEAGFTFVPWNGCPIPDVPLDALVVDDDEQAYSYLLRLPDGHYWYVDFDCNFYPADDSEGAVYTRYTDDSEIECTLEEFALLSLADRVEQETPPCEGCGGEGVLLGMDPINPPRCPVCT